MPTSQYPNLIPRITDRCAVSPWDSMKRAALLFDKVYVPSDSSIDDEKSPPIDLAFGFTNGDLLASVECLKLTDKILWGDKGPPAMLKNINKLKKMYLQGEYHTENPFHAAHRIQMMQYRGIANAYSKLGLNVTPVYSTENKFFDEYLVGTDLVYQSLIRNVIQIDEPNVKWKQILEFKKDKAALKKVPRFALLATGMY